MTTTRPSTGAGWFPDPYDSRFIRYWDGARWTEHTQPAPGVRAPEWLDTQPSPAVNAAARPWWQTWWAIVPGILLCFPVGLVGLWLRKGTSNLVKGLVTAAVALMLVASAISGASGSGPESAGTSVGTARTVASATPTPKSKPAPKVARVPALKGLGIADARAELRSRHLRVVTIERRPSALPVGTVLSQSFRNGKQLRWGTGVALVVASPLPRVPSVVGKVQAVAAHLVRSAGFRVHVTHETVTSGRDGVALSVSPSPGSSVRPHSVVTIVVSHLVRPVVAAPTQAPPSPSNCTPGYSPCLTPAYDYDCAGGSGDGPKYVYGTVRVTGSDQYDLDADGDGYGCD